MNIFKKISQLDATPEVYGEESVPIVQSGRTVRMTLNVLVSWLLGLFGFVTYVRSIDELKNLVRNGRRSVRLDGGLYVFKESAPAAADGVNIVAAQGGGFWVRQIDSVDGILLHVDTMNEFRNLNAFRRFLLSTKVAKGVILYGYRSIDDIPTSVIYRVSSTTEAEDGGSIVQVGSIKLETKFRDVNVEYFGASSDIADNYDFIQKSINYIQRNPLSKLVFSPNTFYSVSKKISIPFSIEICGSGGGIQAETVTTDLMELTADYNKIDGLIVKGRYVSNQLGDLVFNNSNFNRLTNCKFVNPSNAGVIFNKSSGNIVNSCHFEDKSFGVLLRDSYGNTITGNYFTRGYRRGVFTENMGGYAVVPLGDGIKMSSGLTSLNNMKGGVKTTINGNIFYNVYRDAVDMFTDGECIIFTSNIVIAPEALGLDIKTIWRDNPDVEGGTSILNDRQTRNLIISNNYFEDCGLALGDAAAISIKSSDDRPGQAPSIEKGVHNAVISGNQFHGGIKSAVIMQYCKNITLTANLFIGVPKENIYIERESQNINAFGNIFELKGNAAYALYATHNENYKNNRFSDNTVIGDATGGTAVLVYGKDWMIAKNIFSGFATCLHFDRLMGASVQGNRFSNATSQAVRCSSTSNFVSDIDLFNNRFDNCVRGILYNSNSINIISSGNVFKGISVGAEVNVNLVTNYQTLGNFSI